MPGAALNPPGSAVRALRDLIADRAHRRQHGAALERLNYVPAAPL